MLINSYQHSIHPWMDFNAKWLKDLAWLLLNPPLFTCELSGFKAFTLHDNRDEIYDWLKLLDTTGNTTTQTPPQPANYRRLGLYFEALLRFFLIQGHHDGVCQYRLIAHNIPVHKNKITLGEMDFILESNSGELIHLETAVKFYLYCNNNNLPHMDNTPPSWHHWIGPNARDRLDIKLARMLNHQLILPSKTETHKALNNLNIAPSRVTSQHLLCGRLYKPLIISNLEINQTEHTNINLPKSTNNKTLISNWLHINEAKHLLQYKTYEWVILEKMDWLANKCTQKATYNTEQLLTWLAQLATGSAPKNTAGTWQARIPIQIIGRCLDTGEEKNIMLVSNSWPVKLG